MPKIWLSAVDGLHHVATDGATDGDRGDFCVFLPSAQLRDEDVSSFDEAWTALETLPSRVRARTEDGIRSLEGAPCAACMNAAIDMALAEASLVATAGARW